MTADETRMKASFIQWDVPAKKQKDLPPQISDGYLVRMDKERIVFTGLGQAARSMWEAGKFDYTRQDENLSWEDSRTFQGWTDFESQAVTVNRQALIKLLENMDSSVVKLAVLKDRPLRILGLIGQNSAGGMIAPIFEEDAKDEVREE